MKTTRLLPLLLLGLVTAHAATLQSYPQATTPAGDDWLYLQGDTNSIRKLSPSYYPSASIVNAALALKANLLSPVFTGIPQAPTAAFGDNSNQLATTAFVLANGGGGSGAVWGAITGTLSNQIDLGAALSLKATLASPTFTGTPAGPTAAFGTNTTQLATTAFVLANAGSGGAIWGGITGTLSNQTDLNSALAAKVPTGLASASGLTATTAKLIGRTSAGTGQIQEITLGTNLAFSGSTLNATGGSGGGNVTGPGSSVNNHLASFNGTTGQLLADSGAVALTGVTSSAGAGSSGDVPVLNGSGVLDNSFYSTVPAAKGGTNLTATPANGQLLIGNGSGYSLATLTQGTNVTITNSAGSITIAASGGGGGSGDRVSTLINAPSTVTSTTTLSSAAFGTVVYLNPTSADITLTLPTITSNTSKIISLVVLPTATKLITVTGSGSETIDGMHTRVMWKNESAEILVSTTEWNKVAGKSFPMLAAMSGPVQTIANTSSAVICPQNADQGAPFTNQTEMVDVTDGRINIVRPGVYHVLATMTYNNMVNTATFVTAFIIKNTTTTVFAVSNQNAIANAFPAPVATVAATYALGDFIQPATAQNQNGGSATGVLFGSSIYVSEVPSWE